MQLIVMPDNREQIDNTKDLVDGYIIGIKGMSVNIGYNIDIEEMDNIVHLLKDKQLFISLNKNIENSDLDNLESILKKLNDYPIKGIIYSDVCFIKLRQELKLNYDLVWYQEHLTTNYETINYWNSFGVNYGIVSNDITLSDLLDIKKHTDCHLMIITFGYLPMFISKRHIVKNYLNYFNIDDHSDIYYMEKENKTYPIIDNNVATMVFSNNIINSIKEYYNLLDNGFEYIILNGFQIDNAKFLNVVELYKNISIDNLLEYNNKINKMFDNVDTGFMYKDTISKVKNNEK